MITEIDSLFGLMEAFPDERFCVDHLRKIRWRDGEFCPHCDGKRVYHFTDRKTFKCGDCKQRFSIKVGTIFEDTKLPLRKWFMAIWLITNHPKGIASTTLAKDIKITQKSAWFMLHRLRHATTTKSFNAPLSGTAEADIPEHLDRYLHEMSWRFNRRDMRVGARMNDMLAYVEGRLTYKELTV